MPLMEMTGMVNSTFLRTRRRSSASTVRSWQSGMRRSGCSCGSFGPMRNNGDDQDESGSDDAPNEWVDIGHLSLIPTNR